MVKPKPKPLPLGAPSPPPPRTRIAPRSRARSIPLTADDIARIGARRDRRGGKKSSIWVLVEVALWRLAAGWPASRLQEPGCAVNGLGLG